MSEPTRFDDESLLDMLDLRHNKGFNTKQLVAATGMTRGAICGAKMRVRNAQVECRCHKKVNKTGGMPRNWWRHG